MLTKSVLFSKVIVWRGVCYNRNMKLKTVQKSKTAQERQDDIFRKMSASKKVKLVSDLAIFCLKLNHLNGRNYQSRKIAR